MLTAAAIEGRLLFPLSELLGAGAVPDDIAEVDRDPDSFLNSVCFADSSLQPVENGILGTVVLVVLEEIVLAPFGDAVQLVIGGGGGVSVFEARVRLEALPGGFRFEIELVDVPLFLRVSADVLRPLQPGTSEPVPGVAALEIPLGAVSLMFGTERPIAVSWTGNPSVPRCMIGDSGIIVSAGAIRWLTPHSESPPANTPADFTGLFLDDVAVELTALELDADPTLQLDYAFIGRGGFTGRIDLKNLSLGGAIGGFKFELQEFGLTLVQNAVTASNVQGQITLPFLDEPLPVEIGLSLAGGFTVAVSRPSGLFTVTKPDILEFRIESIGFAVDDGVFIAKLSGSLTPLALGANAPSFDLRELSIDSDGNVRLQGGWLDLPSQYTLDFHGFKIEIAKLGFGKNDDGGKWIGFSGAIKLVEGLPAGASVDGLRVIWYDDGSKLPQVTLDGVGVEFAVPDVLRFKGSVRFSGKIENTLPNNAGKEIVQRFDGAIKLEILALNMSLDATLVVGQATGARGDYGFFAIYLAVELPAGIPLGATGLAFYGFAGLFATQMEPNRVPQDGWYENLDGSPGWYKKSPVGIVSLKDKWGPTPGSLALGAGTTIGTLPDNGQTFHGKLLFLLVLPGPIIMLEGRGDLLKKRSKQEGGGVSEEPLFRAVAVLDFREGTATIGVDARYKYGSKGELLDIRGSAEAFFSFQDASAWHIYIGRKEPRERRILAQLFRIFQANAYFMLDGKNPFFQTGAWIGYELALKFGPAALAISAFIQGDAVVSRKPVHLFGELTLQGSIKVSLFGIGFGLTARAYATADVFDPFHLLFEFSFKIQLFWPLPDFEVHFPLEWGPNLIPPPLPVPLKEIAVEHLKVSTTWPLPRDGALPLLRPDYNRGDDFLVDAAPTPSEPAPGEIPVVPVDGRVQITFGRPINDDAKISVNPQATSPEWEQIGDTSEGQGPAKARYGPAKARFSLQKASLSKRVGTQWIEVAWTPNDSPATPFEKLYGSWAVVPSSNSTPGAVDQTKLMLWSKNPFDYSRHTGHAWEEWISIALPNYPCVPPAPPREECFDLSGIDPEDLDGADWHPPGHPEITVRFDTADGVTRVTILLPPNVDGIRVEPPIGAHPTPVRTCADFRTYPAATGPNPRVDYGMQFETWVLAGGRLVPSASTVIEAVAGSDSGLACGHELTISLPRLSNVIEAIVSRASTNAEILATRSDGALVDRKPLVVGRASAVRLDGEGISHVRLRTGGLAVMPEQGEGLLHLLCFTANPLAGTALTGTGQQVETSGTPDGGLVVTSPGADLSQITLLIEPGTTLGQVCITMPPDPVDVRGRAEKDKHLKEETARWSQIGDLFEPHTTYRVKLVTRVEAKSDQPLEWAGAGIARSKTHTETQEQFAFFRTAGPPGLATFSPPEGLPADAPSTGALDDLAIYVRQTIPPTVPAPGQQPFLPRPVYRAYDVGVEFNADYVELMYRMTGRDLALHLYDSNNQPIRGADGRILSLAIRWDQSGQPSLTETEERWIKTVNASTCATIDEATIPRSTTLATGGPELLLRRDAVYQARLVPLLLHENFQSFEVGTSPTSAPTTGGVWTVADPAGVPSTWVVQESGTPLIRYVTQTASVSSGSLDGRDPVKPGTYLLLADRPDIATAEPSQPGNWSDVRVRAIVRTAKSDGAVGLAFRYRDPNNFYRFSMDGTRRYRRLVKVVGSIHTILAEDPDAGRPNVDCELTIEAIAGKIRVLQDGVEIFGITDSSLSSGRLGLYAWGDVGARFVDVRVEDFSENAKPVYRFDFTTSNFANFFHHLHSFADETWRVFENLAALKTVLPTAEPDAEHRVYDAAAQQALGTRANQTPGRLQISRVESGGQALAFLIESPEPIDWKRASIELVSADRRVDATDPPAAIKLTDADFATSGSTAESVGLLLLEDADPTGCRIERAMLPGPDSESASPPLLLVDDFSGPDDGLLFFEAFGPNALDQYQVIDGEPPPKVKVPPVSRWLVANNRIEQLNDYRGGTVAADALARPGTIALFTSTFANARTTFVIRTASQRDIGVVFRYQGPENYYRFSMARDAWPAVGGFRRLVKRINGKVSLLWEDDVQVDSGQATRIVIETFADRLVGYVNGSLMFNLRDAGLADGKPGFYCWGNTQAFFEGLEIEALSVDPILWEPSLQAISDLVIVDEPGTQLTPSSWSATAGVLSQTAPITGDDGAWEQVVGTADDLAAGQDGSIWSVGPGTAGPEPELRRWNGEAWDDVAPGGIRVAVDVVGFVWIVDAAGAITRWEDTQLRPVPGRAVDIGSGGGGSTYVVGTARVPGGFPIFFWRDPTWELIPDGGATRIAVAPDESPWVVTETGEILSFDGDSQSWQLLPGLARDIAVAADGTVWVVGTSPAQGGFTLWRWNGLDWLPLPGQGGLEVTADPDGNPWVVTDSQTIARWVGHRALKPGTCAIGGPQIDDAQVDVQLRSDSDGAIGILFRYQDDANYYRFSMDRRGNYRRVIKKVRGTVTTLWEDRFSYATGQTYHVSLRMEGGRLSGHFNGVRIFAVRDVALASGRVGFYAHANPGAKFEKVVVTNAGRNVGAWTIRDETEHDGPSRWGLAGGSLAQRSAIGAADPLRVDGTLAFAGDPIWTGYRFSATLFGDTGAPVGVLFRYLDEGNHYRLTLDGQANLRTLTRVKDGVGTTLWQAPGGYPTDRPLVLTVQAAGAELTGFLDGQQLFEVVDSTLAAGTVGVHCSRNPAARFDHVQVRALPLRYSALLRDRFAEGDLTGWTFENPGLAAPVSEWATTEDGLLHQPSRGGLAGPRLEATLALAVSGSSTWTDVLVVARLSGQTPGPIGLVAAYHDPENYHLFSLDWRRKTLELIHVTGGTASLLWELPTDVLPPRDVSLAVHTRGDVITGFIDGVPAVSIASGLLLHGQVGIACSADNTVLVSEFTAYPADRAFSDWLLDESFDRTIPDRWTFVDEATQSGSSAWKIGTGGLAQTASIGDPDAAAGDLAKRGSIALAGLSTWTDYRATVRLQSDASGRIGLVVRRLDAENFYRVELDLSTGTRRLVKCLGGTFTTIWEDTVTLVIGREYHITVDALGDQITVYMDGVALCRAIELDLVRGPIGLYCHENPGALFRTVTVAPAVWAEHFVFDREQRQQSGTRIRVHSGAALGAPAIEPNVIQRFAASGIGGQSLRLPPRGATLRVVEANGTPGHRRSFIPASEYSAAMAVSVLRKADGTGVFVIPQAASSFAKAEYRLKLVHRRAGAGLLTLSQNGDSTDEVVILDPPWLTPNSQTLE